MEYTAICLQNKYCILFLKAFRDYGNFRAFITFRGAGRERIIKIGMKEGNEGRHNKGGAT
jgi:hypothetical protein